MLNYNNKFALLKASGDSENVIWFGMDCYKDLVLYYQHLYEKSEAERVMEDKSEELWNLFCSIEKGIDR